MVIKSFKLNNYTKVVTSLKNIENRFRQYSSTYRECDISLNGHQFTLCFMVSPPNFLMGMQAFMKKEENPDKIQIVTEGATLHLLTDALYFLAITEAEKGPSILE